MPKGRMLNRKISLDQEVAKLSKEANILYTWTIPHLDCQGKIHANPDILKGVVCPYLKYMTPKMIEKCLFELNDTPLVIVYGNGCKYVKFLGFDKNQDIREDREAPSEIPDPTPEELQSKSSVTPGKDKLSKDKRSKGHNTQLTDEEFIKSLKENPAYKKIDIDKELAKMDAWLITPKGKGRKKTRQFILNWLNRIDTPVELGSQKLKPADPNCKLRKGNGEFFAQGTSKIEICSCRKG